MVLEREGLIASAPGCWSWREGETLQERVVGGRYEPSEGLRTEV